MDILSLRYFLAVVREENITRAAKVLHITQPSLSRQMAQLENALGTQLFIRGKTLALTDAGVMLRRRAEEIVELMDKTESELEAQGDLGGIISIGSGGLASSAVLTKAMTGFRQKYPKVQYDFYANSAEYVKDRLDRGLLDFGLLMEPIDITKYDYIRMSGKERWGVLMRTDSPLTTKNNITKKDLIGLPIITSSRTSVRNELANWFGSDYSNLNIFATHNLITNTVNLVDGAIAYGLTIEGAVELFLGERLTFRPLYPELSMTSVFAWKKFQPFFSTAGRFLEYFKQVHSELEHDDAN